MSEGNEQVLYTLLGRRQESQLPEKLGEMKKSREQETLRICGSNLVETEVLEMLGGKVRPKYKCLNSETAFDAAPEVGC